MPVPVRSSLYAARIRSRGSACARLQGSSTQRQPPTPSTPTRPGRASSRKTAFTVWAASRAGSLASRTTCFMQARLGGSQTAIYKTCSPCQARGLGVARSLIEAVTQRRRGSMAPPATIGSRRKPGTVARVLYDKVAKHAGFIRYDFPLRARRLTSIQSAHGRGRFALTAGNSSNVRRHRKNIMPLVTLTVQSPSPVRSKLPSWTPSTQHCGLIWRASGLVSTGHRARGRGFRFDPTYRTSRPFEGEEFALIESCGR